MLPSLLSFSLSAFAFAFTPTLAFSTSYSNPTQCSPFTVTWSASNGSAGPPFVLLLLPFDAPPAIFNLPDASYDAATKTGKYTLDKLPFKSGTQFLVSMDDGYGRGTGGVSLVQTVAGASDASCITPNLSSMGSFFALNPAVPSQCASQTVQWNATRYRLPPDVRGFIPGGQAFGLDRPTSNSATQQVWDVQIRQGTQMVFLVQPAASDQNTPADGNTRTSPLITVTGKSSDTCLSPNSPSSTVKLAFTIELSSTTSVDLASTASVTQSTTISGNVKVAAIAGGVVGGLGFLAILCASIVLYRSFKRKFEAFPASSNRGPGGSSYGASSHLRPRPFVSSKHSTPGNKSTAGITIASTQVSGARTTSTRKYSGRQASAADEFGTQLSSDLGSSRVTSSARFVSPSSTAFSVPSHKPPLALALQARTADPLPPLPRDPSPVVSSDGGGEPRGAYGVPGADEKRTELGDVLARSQAHPHPPRDMRARTPDPQPWRAHPFANPLAAVSPRPPPAPLPRTSISARGDDEDGEGGEDRDQDQAVSEEYAFGSRRGLSMRARMSGVGGVYSPQQVNEMETQYIRHTDAGVVRVVELPPMYGELQR